MRVLIAVEQPKVRFALRLLLKREPELSVVGEDENVESLMTQIETSHPDMVLLDWDLPTTNGEDVLCSMREVYPDVVVIVLSGRLEAKKAALAAGANALISKGDPPERLLEAVTSFGSRCRQIKRKEEEDETEFEQKGRKKT